VKAIMLICGDLVMARERSSGSNKGKPDPASIHWEFMAENNVRSMNSTGGNIRWCQGQYFTAARVNTIQDTTPPMYLTRTGIRSKSSIKASDGTSHRQGMVADIGDQVDDFHNSRETSAPTGCILLTAES